MAKKLGVKVFKNYQVPEISGTYYRLLCMTGERKGFSFIIEKDRIVLGRSKEADIKVMDVKSSREHAELVRYENTYIITDLGSHNGIVVNDLKVTQHKLKNNDTIVIGSTVYKYNILNIKNSLSLVKNGDNNIENLEDGDEFDSGEVSELHNKSKKKNNRIVILIALIAGMALFLFDEEPENVNKKVSRNRIGSQKSQLKKLLKSKRNEIDKELNIKLKSVIHKGLREFREKNYFRALEYFNLALNFDPQNGRAEFYVNKTQQRIDQTIKQMFTRAKREADQLKYVRSMKTYCSVIKYLQDYAQDDRYKDAKTNIEYIEKKIGMEKGEFICLQK